MHEPDLFSTVDSYLLRNTDLRLYRPLSSISDEEIRFFAEQVHDWPAESQSGKLSGIDGLVEGLCCLHSATLFARPELSGSSRFRQEFGSWLPIDSLRH